MKLPKINAIRITNTNDKNKNLISIYNKYYNCFLIKTFKKVKTDENKLFNTKPNHKYF